MNNIIESPISDIINKYISSITSKASLSNSIMYIENSIIYLFSFNSVMNTVYAKELDPTINIAVNLSKINEVPSLIYENDYIAKQYISKYKDYYSFGIGDLLASINNAKSDEEFNECISGKSKDGCLFYKLKSLNGIYFIPIMTGFPSLNSSDDIDIYVYKNNIDTDTYIIKETIYKKKINCKFDTMFTILKYS